LRRLNIARRRACLLLLSCANALPPRNLNECAPSIDPGQLREGRKQDRSMFAVSTMTLTSQYHYLVVVCPVLFHDHHGLAYWRRRLLQPNETLWRLFHRKHVNSLQQWLFARILEFIALSFKLSVFPRFYHSIGFFAHDSIQIYYSLPAQTTGKQPSTLLKDAAFSSLRNKLQDVTRSISSLCTATWVVSARSLCDEDPNSRAVTSCRSASRQCFLCTLKGI